MRRQRQRRRRRVATTTKLQQQQLLRRRLLRQQRWSSSSLFLLILLLIIFIVMMIKMPSSIASKSDDDDNQEYYGEKMTTAAAATTTTSNIDINCRKVENFNKEKEEEEEGHFLYYYDKEEEGEEEGSPKQQKQQQQQQHSQKEKEEEEQSYIILGVSGGLQDGFPDHEKLDYYVSRDDHDGVDVVVPAIYLGRGLVRGYKAYLDVMQPTWRQYVSTEDGDDGDDVFDDETSSTTEEEEGEERQHPPQKLRTINSNVIASGCYHHANEYWMYLVDSRQVLTTLMNEPRFLSITPDLGLVDLTISSSSSSSKNKNNNNNPSYDMVRHFAYELIKEQNKLDYTHVAFPIVTAAWYNPTSHIPSPIVQYHKDGTQVTNFPYSLAKWAGIDLSNTTTTTTTSSSNSSSMSMNQFDDGTMYYVDGSETTQVPGYWDKVRNSILRAEKQLLLQQQIMDLGQQQLKKKVNNDDNDNDDFPPFHCKKKARFGVTPDMARINYPLTKQTIRRIILKYNNPSLSSLSSLEEEDKEVDDSTNNRGRTNHHRHQQQSYDIDFERGTIIIITNETKKNKQD